jgi:hypothetical protein
VSDNQRKKIEMFPKDKTIDWSSLTDKEFAKAIALRSKKHRKIMTKPVSDLTNDEMLEAIKLGRFDKQK